MQDYASCIGLRIIRMNKIKEIMIFLVVLLTMAAVSVVVKRVLNDESGGVKPNVSYSDSRIPLLHVSNPNTGIDQIIIMLEKRALPSCKVGLDNVWKSLKSNCQECVRIKSQCIESLPVDYQPVLKGMKYKYNYVWGSKELFIFISKDVRETANLCRELAGNLSINLNRSLRCILADDT